MDAPDITELLKAWRANNPAALDALIPQVIDDLRKIARNRMAGERPTHTLQPTALINEVYIRLAGWKVAELQNRHHFFAVCAGLMRRILIDHARERAALKRGPASEMMTLDVSELAGAPDKTVDVIALDTALKRLAELDARKGRVVELRVFGGLTAEETAEVLEMSVNTVQRDWSFSLAWLRRDLKPEQRV